MAKLTETLVALDGGWDGQAFDDDHGCESFEWPTGYSIMAVDGGFDLYYGDPINGNGDGVRDDFYFTDDGPRHYATAEDAKAGAERDQVARRILSTPMEWLPLSQAQTAHDARDAGRTERDERSFCGPSA